MSSNVDRRIIVYPAYIDSTKTVAQGRKIPKESACEKPLPREILDCCNHLNCPAELEDGKGYARDYLIRGRVRVQLLDAQGKPGVAEIPNRRTLLLRVAQLVPKHPARSKKAQAQAQAHAHAKQTAPAAPAAISKANSKKGKKGRK